MSLTLHKRRLQGITTEKYVGSGLDMSCTEAFGSKWYGCSFTDCDFSGSNLQSSEFFDCEFIRCNFRMSHFRAGKVRSVRFEECDLRQSVFAGVTPLEKTFFVDSKLQYATFYDSTVRDVSFQDSNLHGTDLRFIEARDVKFHGANLWSAVTAFGCQFWNCDFDERSCDLFVAMVARKYPNPEKAKLLLDVAGFNAKVVEKLMSERTA